MCAKEDVIKAQYNFNARLDAVLPRRVGWVNIEGVPDQEGKYDQGHLERVLNSELPPPLHEIRVRDPERFVSGGLHANPEDWVPILGGHPMAHDIMGWIRDKVDVASFSRPFKGAYKGFNYDSHLTAVSSIQNHAIRFQGLNL